MSKDRDQPGTAADATTAVKPDSQRTEAGDGAAQSRFEALLAAAVDAILVIGDDARIQTFSAAAEHLFGYRASEVLGKNISCLMPEPFRSEHDGYLRNYRESGVPKIIEIHRANVMEKTEAGSLAHLVRMALLTRD